MYMYNHIYHEVYLKSDDNCGSSVLKLSLPLGSMLMKRGEELEKSNLKKKQKTKETFGWNVS